MAAKDITITLTIDCPTMYDTYASGSSRVDAWDQVLNFSDDNSGALEGDHIDTFESKIYAGKKVTWQAETKSGNSSSYKVSIDKIVYEPNNSDDNVFSETTINGNSGKVTATVLPTAPVLTSGDNESYTVSFTVSPNPPDDQRPPKQWDVDPKLKVDPST